MFSIKQWTIWIHTWQNCKKNSAALSACPVCMAIHIMTSTQSSTASVDWGDASQVAFRRCDAQASNSWVGCDFLASGTSEPVRDWTMNSKLYTCLKVFIIARNSLRWGNDFLFANSLKQLLPSIVRIGWKKSNTLSSIGLESTADIFLRLPSSTAHATSRNFETPPKLPSYKMRLLYTIIELAKLDGRHMAKVELEGNSSHCWKLNHRESSIVGLATAPTTPTAVIHPFSLPAVTQAYHHMSAPY